MKNDDSFEKRERCPTCKTPLKGEMTTCDCGLRWSNGKEGWYAISKNKRSNSNIKVVGILLISLGLLFSIISVALYITNPKYFLPPMILSFSFIFSGIGVIVLGLMPKENH